MSMGRAHTALESYGKVGVQSSVESASPFRLVQMLMEGALGKITIAAGHMQRGEIAQKGENISLAISIVDGLRASLDKAKGGDVAANLERLYDYMIARLLEANLKNDPAILQEVHGLMSEIKSGWDALPAQVSGNDPQGVPGGSSPRKAATG